MKKIIYIFIFILPIFLFSCSGSNNEAVELKRQLEIAEQKNQELIKEAEVKAESDALIEAAAILLKEAAAIKAKAKSEAEAKTEANEEANSKVDAEFQAKADAPDVKTLDLLQKESTKHSIGLKGYKMKLIGKISKIAFFTIDESGYFINNEPGFQISDDDGIHLICILRKPSDVANLNLKANQEIIFEGFLFNHDTKYNPSIGGSENINFKFRNCEVLDIRD